MISFIFRDSLDLNKISRPLSPKTPPHYKQTHQHTWPLEPDTNNLVLLQDFASHRFSANNQSFQIYFHLSTTRFATLSISSSYAFFFFVHKIFFFAYLSSVTRDYWCLCAHWARLIWVDFFTVESNVDCCQKKLSSVVNSGAVFVLCLLLSVISSLFSAAVVTLSIPAIFLTAFYFEYFILCLDIFSFWVFATEGRLLVIKVQFLSSPQVNYF